MAASTTLARPQSPRRRYLATRPAPEAIFLRRWQADTHRRRRREQPRGRQLRVAGGTTVDGGYNLDSGTTCALGAPTDKNDLNPQLGSLQANGGATETLEPAATSPLIDEVPVGTNGCGTSIKVDQRGVHRPQGSGCDIGAYETGDVGLQSLLATPNPVQSGSSLTYTTTVANAGAIEATVVKVKDTLPGGVSFTSAKASQGSCRGGRVRGDVHPGADGSGDHSQGHRGRAGHRHQRVQAL